MAITTDLADKVRSLLLVLLANNYSILEDVVVALVSLAGLQLRHNIKRLLLLDVVLESDGVVFLLGLALATRAALSLLGLGSRGGTLRGGSSGLSSTPLFGSGGNVTPAVSFDSRAAGSFNLSVGLSGSLDL